jgi:hypothetical protein
MVSTGLGVSKCFLSSGFDVSTGFFLSTGPSTTDLDSGLGGSSSFFGFTEIFASSGFGSSGFLVTSGDLGSSGLGLS